MTRATFVLSRAACAAVWMLAVSCGATPATSDGAKDARSEAHPLIGKAAPEPEGEVVGGIGPKTLKAAKGKVVILDFWGTFCAPCKKSFPKYQAITDEFAGDVAIIAMAVDEPDDVTKSDLLAFAKESRANFAIVWDKTHSAAAAYGMKDLTMPSSFVLDKDGTVRHLHRGFADDEEVKIAAEVEELLK